MTAVTGTRAPLLLTAAAGCVLAPLLMLAGVESPLRAVAAMVLFGLAPGVALLPLVSRRAAATEVSLVIGVSLAVSALMAQLMLSLAVWSAAGGACVLAAACLASIVAQLRSASVEPRPEEV